MCILYIVRYIGCFTRNTDTFDSDDMFCFCTFCFYLLAPQILLIRSASTERFMGEFIHQQDEPIGMAVALIIYQPQQKQNVNGTDSVTDEILQHC